MSRWHQLSNLPVRVLGLAGILTVAVDGFVLFVWVFWGQWMQEADSLRILLPPLTVSIAIVCACGGLLAMVRIRRHPLINREYGKWLTITPWHSGKRLPFGPATPVWRDLILLMALGLFAALKVVVVCRLTSASTTAITPAISNPEFGSANPFSASQEGLACAIAAAFPAVVFLATWMVATGLVVVREHPNFGAGLLTSAGLIVHMIQSRNLLIAALAGSGTLAVAFVTIWKLSNRMVDRIPKQSLDLGTAPGFQARVAPVFHVLSPDRYQSVYACWLVSRRRTWIHSFLILMIWLTVFPWNSSIYGLLIIAIMVTMLSMLHGVALADRCQTNFSLPARWSLRRWIVPAYDRIWLGPCMMILSSASLLSLVALRLINPAWGCPVAILLPMSIAVHWPRDYQTWSLTSPVSYLISHRRS
ncbi:MAG: hypothetical protein KDA91_03770 [Planctomycetaceae bacterium]|nr:hypothetical protein [Planctomycetaceae bacterium]